MRADRNELAVAGVFAGIALLFALDAWRHLPIGAALRMGPGYFPLIVCALLLAVAAAIAIRSLVSSPSPFGPVSWRGVALLGIAPILFGLTVRGLGLIPSVAAVVLLSAFASKRMTMRLALALTVGLTAFCVLVFHYALGLPMPLFGSWIIT